MLKATERPWGLWAAPFPRPRPLRRPHLRPKSDQTRGPHEDRVHGDNQGRPHLHQAQHPGWGQSEGEGLHPTERPAGVLPGGEEIEFLPVKQVGQAWGCSSAGWMVGEKRAAADTPVELNRSQAMPGTVCRNGVPT